MGGNAVIALIEGNSSNYGNDAVDFPFNVPFINNNSFPSKNGERRKQHINVLNRPKTQDDHRRVSYNNTAMDTALHKSADLRSLSNKSPSHKEPCRGESLKDYENSAVNQVTQNNQNQHK